jgi:hypothetical protein
MKALLAQRERFEGPELEEDNSRGQSLQSNNMKALLAQRERFEGPGPELK